MRFSRYLVLSSLLVVLLIVISMHIKFLDIGIQTQFIILAQDSGCEILKVCQWQLVLSASNL